jgi:hypothetical protein
MPKRIPRRPRVHASRPEEPVVPTVRALRRQVARLTAELRAAEARHRRQLAALRRAADRRMAAVVQEIAALRHHEARAEALARVLAERDAARQHSETGARPGRLSREATSPPSG